MAPVVLGMLLVLALGVVILLAVAVPARREGRDLLTPHGEDVVARAKERTETMTAATKDRVGEARDRVGEARERIGTRRADR